MRRKKVASTKKRRMKARDDENERNKETKRKKARDEERERNEERKREIK